MNPTLLPLPPGGRRGGGGGYFAYGAEAAAILPAASLLPRPRLSQPDTRIHRGEGNGGPNGGGSSPAWDLAARQRRHLVLGRVPRCFPSRSRGGASGLMGGPRSQSRARVGRPPLGRGSGRGGAGPAAAGHGGQWAPRGAARGPAPGPDTATAAAGFGRRARGAPAASRRLPGSASAARPLLLRPAEEPPAARPGRGRRAGRRGSVAGP